MSNPLLEDDDDDAIPPALEPTPADTPTAKIVKKISTDIEGLNIAAARRAMWTRLERGLVVLALALATYWTTRLAIQTENLTRPPAAPAPRAP